MSNPSPAARPTFETLEARTLLSATLGDDLTIYTPPTPKPAAIDVPEPSNTSDFDGDGDNDLIFRAAAFGNTVAVQLEDFFVADGASFRRLSDPNWQLAGVADFDGDSDPDLLFRNTVTKRMSIWIMDGINYVGSTSLPANAGAFEVAAVGDFTTDGTADVALINPTTGKLVIWELDNGVLAPNGVFVVNRTIGPQWHASGAGDFDADGDADLFFRNTFTGRNVIWEMNDTMFVQSYGTAALLDQSWEVGDIKDFDGDGDADIAWRNTQTGQNAIWTMENDGAVRVGSALLPAFPNLQYAMAYSRPVQITPALPVPVEGETEVLGPDSLLAVEPLVTFASV